MRKCISKQPEAVQNSEWNMLRQKRKLQLL
jgi:hypothetical protein